MKPLHQMTREELQQLIVDAGNALYAAEQAAASEDAQNRDEAGAAIADLEALLGPEGAEPGITSIRSVLAYDDATIVEHAGLAFRLILQGMELNVQTQITLAKIAHAKG